MYGANLQGIGIELWWLWNKAQDTKDVKICNYKGPIAETIVLVSTILREKAVYFDKDQRVSKVTNGNVVDQSVASLKAE